MSDQDARLSPLLGAVAAAGLDAAALVPGPNFRRLFGRDFHLMERPLVVIVGSAGGRTRGVRSTFQRGWLSRC